MSVIKAVLAIELPGATMLQEKVCQSDPKNYNTDRSYLLVHEKQGKKSVTKRENLIIKTRKSIPAIQKMNFSEEQYEYMTSKESCIRPYRDHQWKSMSKVQRLDAHFQQIAEYLGGKVQDFEILD